MSNLEIPKRAYEAGWKVHSVDPANTDYQELVEAAAAIIVATELRRLAVEFYDGPQRWPLSKVQLLRDRAAELDPGGSS